VLRHPDSYRDKSGFGAEAPTNQKILNALRVISLIFLFLSITMIIANSFFIVNYSDQITCNTFPDISDRIEQTHSHEAVDWIAFSETKIRTTQFFHSLRVRTAGADTFIKFNIHVEPDSSLREVHKLCDTIEKELNVIIPRSEVYIHAEPQEINNI